MRKIGIVDYGQGNINSVSKALDKLNVEYLVSGSVDALKICSHLILPGVGAFPTAMKKLEDLKLVEFLQQCAVNTPILGICLGAQIFMDYMEEDGGVEGLGFIKGEVIKLPIEESNTSWSTFSFNKNNLSEDS